MDVWKAYHARQLAHGSTPREVLKNRLMGTLGRKISSSLSLHSVLVKGVEQEIAVASTNVSTQKTIHSLQGELFAGDYVQWQGAHWLIYSVDLDNELYSSGAMMQCNHYLEWINLEGQIVGCWCHVSDGTKYMTGESYSSYAGNDMVLGESRISVLLPRTRETVRLGRSNRFLIDDPESISLLSYRLTKPFKVGGVYDGHGVMGYVLAEAVTEMDDNLERHIADYYKYFPRPKEVGKEDKPSHPPSHPDHLEKPEKPEKPKREVWF